MIGGTWKKQVGKVVADSHDNYSHNLTNWKLPSGQLCWCSIPPWSNAVLITSCHAVQVQWNELALWQHCKGTRWVLYHFHAEDTIKGKPLSISKKWAMAWHVMKETRYTVWLKLQGGLSSVVEMEIGSKVLITTNIDTDMDNPLSDFRPYNHFFIWVDEPVGL